MSEREVKLTRRTPSDEAEDIGRKQIPWKDGFVAIESGHQRIKVRQAYEAMHDVAPSDATEALEGLVWTVFKLLREEATLNDLGGSYDSLAATPAGAALIRQAMERDGST